MPGSTSTLSPVLRGGVRYLLEAQGPEGSWTYHTRVKDEVYRDPEEEHAIQISGGVPLEGDEAPPPELARARCAPLAAPV
ncbi:MAG: hypothetical protein HY721_31350 [Planctomycetes bacterium]|nr:hypothetical protein [Planctomycetota bacterium]